MAGDISRTNGQKGGRPKGLATIERERAKDYIAGRIAEYMPAIFQALVDKALEGDVIATRELFDRAWGKPHQAIVGVEGQELVIRITGESASRYGLLPKEQN